MNTKTDEISTAEAARSRASRRNASPLQLRRGRSWSLRPRPVRVGMYSRRQIKHWLANRPQRRTRVTFTGRAEDTGVSCPQCERMVIFQNGSYAVPAWRP
jgi:hypothetical protein